MNLLVGGLAIFTLVPAFTRADLTSGERAQDSRSMAKAAAVTKLLDERKLDAVAALEDAQSGRFVAALYYPGTQLLVVSAVHPQPELMAQRIADRHYRDLYLDLQGPAMQQGRFFVLDLRADGLKRTRDDAGAFDQTYVSGTDRISYDGDWTGQRLTRSKYDERFTRDDERYAEMLVVLERALNRLGTTAVR